MGGQPILRESARLPITLPAVDLDTTADPYGAGYHYSPSLAGAARTSGFWPNGRPARCVSVVASEDAVECKLSSDCGKSTLYEYPHDLFARYDVKMRIRRASALTIAAVCTDNEIRKAMREIVYWSLTADELVEEQWAWYVALGRPSFEETKVVEGLHAALAHRQLDWTLRRFERAEDAWAARAGELAWALLNGRTAHHDERPGPTWSGQLGGPSAGLWLEPIEIGNFTFNAWEAQWDRWDPWDVYVANQAKHALVGYISLSGGWFTDKTTANLSVGIRDAYYHGLAVAVPTGPRELGYAMDSKTYDRERQPST